MKVGIDFDRVIFDTDRFNEYLKEEVEGLEHVEGGDVYDKNGNYVPEKHAQLCGIQVDDIYDAIDDLERFVFEDVGKLRELDHELVLVTRGRERFQKAKIRAAGIEDVFDQIVIIEEGTKNVEDIDFLVDDQNWEIEDAGVPGYVFDSGEDSIETIIEKVKDFNG